MIRSPQLSSLVLFAALPAIGLASCSPAQDAQSNAIAHFELSETGRDQASGDASGTVMPGKIDPPGAVWTATNGGARYGEPGKTPLIELACHSGMVTVSRNTPSDEGAKALLAFVGYRGILRMKVASDGAVWRGSLAADDPHWIAVTGGPFYATVPGGGKVISPASSIAANVVTACKMPPEKPKPDDSLAAPAPA